MYKIHLNNQLLFTFYNKHDALVKFQELLAAQVEGQFYWLQEPAPCLLVGQGEY